MHEYGVMVALILVGSIVAVKGIGRQIDTSFRDVALTQGGVLGK